MDRRRFLRTGVASAAGLGALATAGCSQLPVDVPGIGGGGSYGKWLHAPGEMDGGDHYSFNVDKPRIVLNNEDVFDDDEVSAFEDSFDGQLSPAGIDTDETERIIGTNVTTVVTGSFDSEEVADELEDNGFDDDDEVGGFTIYANGNETRAWAVGGSALVQTRANGGETAVDVAETAIEIQGGDGERYADESEAMGVLTNKLNDGFSFGARTFEERDADDPESGQFENSTGFGGSLSLNGSTVTLQFVVAFDDSDDPDEGDLEDFADAFEDSTFDDVEDISFNTSGRAGIISGKMDADDATL